jgi:hypothetical protein
MTVVALSHGYPPLWNMGGEVSLHRTMKAIREESYVLTKTDKPYTFEGISVRQINTPNVLDINADPMPIAKQLQELNARVVIGQNELSIVNVHTPPRYGSGISAAMLQSDYAIYNTKAAAKAWGEPDAFVLHPPISPLPKNISNSGDAYTLLSSLTNKGVGVVIDLAKMYPNQRFIIVRSPAEPTHGLKNIEEIVAKIPNIELHPRVAPENVDIYLKQTRILLVPSRYETYGMSAIEAAGYGIPSVHVDTPDVREGIGGAAILIRPLNLLDAQRGINQIEKYYNKFSEIARIRAEAIHDRQKIELEQFAHLIENIKKPDSTGSRKKAITLATRKYF